MKVLMLGWEFPPHISGGLGTACAGLTQALEKQHVDILFVIPKLHGQERADHTTFINASSIPIRQHPGTNGNGSLSNASPRPATPLAVSSESAIRSERRSLTTVEVTSFLSPYDIPALSKRHHSIEQWNYPVGQPEGQHSVVDTLPHPAGKETQYIKKPYSFSGTYGRNLFDEVGRYAQVAAEIARNHTFDIIHAHDWMTYQAGLEAKRVSGKPLVLHVHATEVDRSGAGIHPAIFEIERKGMTGADSVVTVSQWTKNIAIKHYKIPPEKLEVIHNGINPKEDSRVSGAGSPFSRIVTFLGRVTHQKGPMYFVEAAKKVHEQFPDTHFIVAGAGDMLPMMIERIAQLRLSNHVHFTGFLKGEDVRRIWEVSNVYVMPSVSEPFGIAPLEAIQAGVPVILSNQAGVSEVMPHAIKVDFWDTEALAEAICNVLRFKSLANTLKKNGADEIKRITWDKAAKKLTKLYYDLSSENDRRKKDNPVLSNPSTKAAEHTSIL